MQSAWFKLKRIIGRGRNPLGAQVTYSRQMVNPGRLTIFFWLYLAQATAGSVIGFILPFLYYFGFL
jgi:hypothetical protein